MSDAMDCTWKVFIPHSLPYHKDGYLVGRIWSQEQLIYIVGVIRLEDFNDKDNWSFCCNVADNQESLPTLKVVGVWNSHKNSKVDQEKFYHLFQTGWLELKMLNRRSLSARVYTNSSRNGFFCCTCVLFDPNDLQKSYFIQESITAHKNDSEYCQSDTIPSAVVKIVQDVCQNADDIAHLEENHRMTSYFHKSPCLKSSCLDIILTLFISPIKFISSLFVFKNTNKYIDKVLFTSAFARVMKMKHSQIELQTKKDEKSPLKKLCYLDLGYRQIMDSLLGILCLFLLSSLTSPQDIASLILYWTKTTVISLSSILQWLMGSPAGLKLNSQLNGFLGSFFKYNIYVWTTYLTVILEPILATFLQCSLFSGIFGFSLQLSLLQDIVSLMALHIYCFYVFASRFYYFQVYTLSSLWRLFCGKKWNVLRHRLDTASNDIDHLFVGTLFFTVLLFLLPTTAVYYSLFTLLHLVILLFHTFVTSITDWVINVPIYSMMQWLIRAKSVAGHVIFRVHSWEKAPGGTLILAMQVSQFTFSQVFTILSEKQRTNLNNVHSVWSKIIKKIIKGHFI
ncbi:phosphatidylinositol N-acetylglucosaminyltransferase subunit Q-like isoform X2 [Octopus vulgaris]|uniref:Phosphatidylinositol N-acetylglucosaminyltransferase subunit Q n=1 Tax=Octopus vulgaris TaxID=6645 RepID=A0A9Y1GCD1_OCTVU|nr:phosphatidylinositol N-acetylglucosaminyltransferase subunit Q [Octopus vulgaris]CAI9716396.1 phosphatidylinositol N-acetylglucosaminyltransferase subunit Q-like isoform X2 [Octopus vulgaris]